MTFDEYLGQECLIFFANPARWDGKEAAKVKVIGGEPGGIWVEWEEMLADARAAEALQALREGEQGMAYFIPFAEIRMATVPRLKLPEGGS